MTIMSNVDESFEVLTDGSTYSGVAGLVAGAMVGGLLTYLPFGKLGRVASIGRTVFTAGVGGYLIHASKGQTYDLGKGMNYAGTVLILSSVVQVAGMVSPNLGGFLGQYSAEDILPQSGSGQVIGQETATHSYSDIKNAEDWDFESMNQDMIHRVNPADPTDSVVEYSPMGHAPTQWFGAEVEAPISPTGGLDQNFGGGAGEPTTIINPMEQDVTDYVSSVDTMGLRAQNPLGKGNLFVTSMYPGGSPPVSYGAEEPTIENTASANVQGGEYFKPFTTADTDMNPLASVRQVSPGGKTPIQWYGSAETINRGQIGNHIGEGRGSVIGQ
jgi:hypothetical protein